MRALVILALLVAICQSHIINREYLEDLKIKINGAFQTATYEQHAFKDLTFHELAHNLGLLRKGKSHLHIPKGELNASLPDSFDSRVQWKDCVGEVRDQASCGSCWAFGAAESFGDRVCIAEGDNKKVDLSTQALVSCDYQNFGCEGGYLDKVWDFLATVGVPTEKCYKYKSAGGSVPACPDKKSHKVKVCDDKTVPVYYRVSKVVHPVTIADIKAEIQANGPMETGFTVYEDFMSYSGGVYKHVTGGQLGGHAIKVLGWGVEKGTNYWIAANSWGTGWGEQGTFRIAEGECDFESEFYGGAPIKTSAYTNLNFLE